MRTFTIHLRLLYKSTHDVHSTVSLFNEMTQFFKFFLKVLIFFRQVEPENAGTAAMLSALALVIGVVSGLQFSVVLDQIVKI